MTVPKIVIIGAGNVGSFSAAVMARKQLGTIYLYDILENLAVGRAMDINQGSPYLHTDSRVTGSDSLDVLDDSDIVIITAGSARHDGMSRLDLLKENLEVIKTLGAAIMFRCTKAKVLVVSNPVDVLTMYMKTSWPEMNVFGLGCSLDTMRFRFFVAESFGGSVDCSRGMVIGTHNENMIPLVNHATIGGVPIRHLLTEDTITGIVKRTRIAGTAIVHKLRVHSGFYAASHVVTQVVESMVFNRLGTFSLSVPCRGEYGYNGICLALPCVVGQEGIQRILEIDLQKVEKNSLKICAEAMTEVSSLFC